MGAAVGTNRLHWNRFRVQCFSSSMVAMMMRKKMAKETNTAPKNNAIIPSWLPTCCVVGMPPAGLHHQRHE
ncbi:hypothetical protein EYF80_063727 [Liparis tanakae]|uniref:Uncharacterized protein n=1 Tax=Liparis tanakae TaxID=230148 RepID=A0A4Z2EBC0_9TELE|nr:hypothetical protein EYF80_063727 [Liparis tanakae]